jgi:hypothetical protein
MISPDNETLLEQVRDLLLENLGDLGASEMTCWLASGDDLEAVANPWCPALVGQRQPLSRGLISQVFVTGMPLMETEVAKRGGHDPSIDQVTGKATSAMMAAPLHSNGDVIGILSAVQLGGDTGLAAFDRQHLNRLTTVAVALAPLVGKLRFQP